MCGKLASYLRMAGYDTAYALDREVEDDDRLRVIAREEGRSLLTRDVELAERTDGALLLRAREPRDQLRELAAAGLALGLAERPGRCGRCNGVLERVPATGSTPAYAPATDEVQQWRCRACEQVFWKGSHWDRVAETFAGL
jgi:uncharacterized protein with PIN domain